MDVLIRGKCGKTAIWRLNWGIIAPYPTHFTQPVDLEQLFKLAQIVLVDLVLAGDNAIVIGLVAAKFSPAHRRKVILYGVGGAVLLRILFAVITVQLLAIKGLLLVGGLLLLWICWKLWCDLRAPQTPQQQADALTRKSAATQDPPMLASIMQILVADVSMSLDNVLAVAGIADGHTVLLVVGLAIAVVFMVFAAGLIAELLQKQKWIAYVGLAVILYVALEMSYKGSVELGLLPALQIFGIGG